MKPSMMILAATLGVATGSCGESGGDTGPGTSGTYAPTINPADFVATVDNRYLPLTAGTVFKYTDGEEDIELTVTAESKSVMGIRCVVVHDVARLAGTERVLEDTFDWFAQDRAGNVWYFGEDTTAFPEGKPPVKTGSWEAGVDGAKPGIVMKANPAVGDRYRQEYYSGQAEDEAEVLAVNEKVTVPYGSFDGCLKTRDWTELEPGQAEHKYYCPGVGTVLVVDAVSSAAKREELLSVSKR